MSNPLFECKATNGICTHHWTKGCINNQWICENLILNLPEKHQCTYPKHEGETTK